MTGYLHHFQRKGTQGSVGSLSSVALCPSETLPATLELRGMGNTDNTKDKSYEIKDEG